MIAKKPQRLKAKTVHVEISTGEAGLYYGASRDLKGLLIASKTREGVLDSAPQTIADMYHASGAEYVEIITVKPDAFAVRLRR